MSSSANGCSQPETPEVWLISCRTATSCFPLAANSGQYLATGA